MEDQAYIAPTPNKPGLYLGTSETYSEAIEANAVALSRHPKVSVFFTDTEETNLVYIEDILSVLSDNLEPSEVVFYVKKPTSAFRGPTYTSRSDGTYVFSGDDISPTKYVNY